MPAPGPPAENPRKHGKEKTANQTLLRNSSMTAGPVASGRRYGCLKSTPPVYVPGEGNRHAISADGATHTHSHPLVDLCAAHTTLTTTDHPSALNEPRALVVDAHDGGRTWLCALDSSRVHPEATFFKLQSIYSHLRHRPPSYITSCKNSGFCILASVVLVGVHSEPTPFRHHTNVASILSLTSQLGPDLCLHMGRCLQSTPIRSARAMWFVLRMYPKNSQALWLLFGFGDRMLTFSSSVALYIPVEPHRSVARSQASGALGSMMSIARTVTAGNCVSCQDSIIFVWLSFSFVWALPGLAIFQNLDFFDYFAIPESLLVNVKRCQIYHRPGVKQQKVATPGWRDHRPVHCTFTHKLCYVERQRSMRSGDADLLASVASEGTRRLELHCVGCCFG